MPGGVERGGGCVEWTGRFLLGDRSAFGVIDRWGREWSTERKSGSF